jgi:hypothetical protein
MQQEKMQLMKEASQKFIAGKAGSIYTFHYTWASLELIYDHTQDKILPNDVSIRGVEHHL